MSYAKNPKLDHVFIPGGAGYVGSVLVPKLLEAGYKVSVLDLFIYGDTLAAYEDHPGLRLVKGDMRDMAVVEDAMKGCDSIIHLACISNDPSFDLNPELGRTINLDCFAPMVEMAKEKAIKRFIYASSSAVYGIKDCPNVTEDQPLEPLTDYSKFKVACEKILHREDAEGFVYSIIRPATVCGYSPRQRLDVVVNILTNLAYNKGEITVMGGSQLRPNIHIQDMCDVYLLMLAAPDEAIHGKSFNAGYENHSVMQLAELVKAEIGDHVRISVQETDDLRSYHVSSQKIMDELGFTPSHTISEAVREIADKLREEALVDSLNNPMYFNIKRMQEIGLE